MRRNAPARAAARAAVGLLAALALAAPEAQAQRAPAGPSTTVIVVRHAEQGRKPANDPGLSDQGWERAEALVDVLGRAGIAAIYTTQLSRTRETARPLAEYLGIESEVVEIAPGGIKQHVEAIARGILKDHAGKVVLVVGHSNTVPLLVRELGADLPSMTEDDYDDLFIVTVPPGRGARTVIRARYGPPERG